MTVKLILRQAQDDKAYATLPFDKLRATTLLETIFKIDCGKIGDYSKSCLSESISSIGGNLSSLLIK